MVRFVKYCVQLSTDRRQFAPSLAISSGLSAWFAYQLVARWAWWSPLFVIVGIVCYTLAEYWYHRWVAHRWLDSVTDDVHHMIPDDYFAAPWFLIAPVAVLIWTGSNEAFMAGVSVAHLWQEIIHYSVHHRHSGFRRLRAHHMYHHIDETHNYGHSTRLWDRVFGTLWRTF